MVVTADGQRAVSASSDSTLKVWALSTRSALAGITLDAPIGCVQLAPDAITIVAGDEVGSVHYLRYCDPSRSASPGS